MGKRILLRIAFVCLAVTAFLAFNARPGLSLMIPEKIPGNYEGKWYGIHCTLMDREEIKGVRHGEAFPDQKIINSWGYQARPIEEIKDLLPEIYYNIVSQPEIWGNIRINESAFIPIEKWPGGHQQLRMEATEKNKGTAKLDENNHLINYINGFPFPGSEKGPEIAWNFVNSRNFGEDLRAKFYTAVTDKNGHSRYSTAEQCYLWWKGRLYKPHSPEYLPNPKNYDFYSAMGFKAPYDMRGIVMITHRYDTAEKEDDQWMYIPTLRRVRRMSTAQRWDKLPGGQDLTWDAVTGFQGKVSNYDWEYLGRKLLLCGHNSRDILQQIPDKPGGGTADQYYQRVNTVMLQYIPKIVSSVSRGVMYLDPEVYCCYYVEFYDRRGRPYLFYNHCWAPHNTGHISPIGFFVADVQRIHSSNNYTYDEGQDEDAVTDGINPGFFQMEFLRKVYGGR